MPFAPPCSTKRRTHAAASSIASTLQQGSGNRLSRGSALRYGVALALGGVLAGACSSPPVTDDPNPLPSPFGGGSGGVAGAASGSGGSGGSGGNAPGGGGGGSSESMGGATQQGGASGSAGTGGMAGSGGGMGMPVALCPEGSLFCEDFEDDTVGQTPGAPWRNSTGDGGVVTVGTEQAFSGTRAVHASAPSGSRRRAYFALDQGSSNIFPGAALEMYGRAMMFLEETPDTAVHWTFIQGEGAANATPAHNRLYRYGGQQQGGAGLMANFETTNISTDCWQHSQRTMPAGAWTCVEWRFAVATNEMEFWLAGDEVADLHVTGSGEGCIGNALNGQWLAPPAFQSLYLGWEQYQVAGNDVDLWIDAVVVSTERVGCPAQ